MSNMHKGCTGQEIAMSSQLALPLESRTESEPDLLRRAWVRSRIRVPYQLAMRVPALVICLRNIAAAESRRTIPRARRARLQPENLYFAREATDTAEPIFPN